MREECLAFINAIIERERPCDIEAKQMGEDDRLIDAPLDSFGYAMFWVEVSDKYGLEDDYTNGIDYDTYTVRELIDVCTKNLP